ncbi:hypothetical protein TMatcc_003225, partial [Talaromyces marneffei ATCC 18224]
LACFVTTQQPLRRRVQPHLLLFLPYSCSHHSFVTQQRLRVFRKSPARRKGRRAQFFCGLNSRFLYPRKSWNTLNLICVDMESYLA